MFARLVRMSCGHQKRLEPFSARVCILGENWKDLSLNAVALCEVCQILRHVVVEGEFVGNVGKENFRLM